jgi:SAM-dependent methyltransferase
MTGAGAVPGPLGTVSDDYGPGYFDTHLGSDAEYDWDSPEWRTFFTNVADRIVAITNPSSVVDVGCASGLLVQALRERGISCDGIDISAHAIDRASPSVRAHLRVAGAENLVGNWDLVTCIEALEHMSSDAAERAIDAMCRASDRVLVSTTPGNFAEPTHINVREPAAWAAAFAERGFFRRTDVDLSFLTSWAVLYERAPLTARDVVHRYERLTYPMRMEVLEKRTALLDATRRLSELDCEPVVVAVGGDNTREVEGLEAEIRSLQSRLEAAAVDAFDLRHRLLTSRDHAMGAEAEAARWRNEQALTDAARSAENLALRTELDLMRQELTQAYDALATMSELHREIYSSETWRIGNSIVRPVTRLSRRRARD